MAEFYADSHAKYNEIGNVRIMVILKRIRVTIFAVERKRILQNSECLSVALFIQQTQRMRPIILSSLAFPPVQNFPTFSHKIHVFRKELLNLNCVF
jgi:hypothetical protein